MTALHPERSRPAGPAVGDGFVVGHTTEDGVEHRTALAEAWAARFELGGPVRRFTARKGQRHLSGLWWSATTGGHVGFESWLERDHVMLLDFDAAVVGIASQPFWLRWCDGAGKEVLHVPDFFARRADGSAVVTDCRPAERRPPARRGQIRGHRAGMCTRRLWASQTTIRASAGVGPISGRGGGAD